MSGISELQPFTKDGHHLGSCSNCGAIQLSGTGEVGSCSRCGNSHAGCMVFLAGALTGGAALISMIRQLHG